MNIWNENYIVKIAVKIDDCDTEEQAIEIIENKLETGEINLNRMEFFIEEIYENEDE
tara:strand:+ start:462 stop:632 length:171 start_codon:yes stop_codon:yes gene_type:complete